MISDRRHVRGLLWLLALSVVAELVVLRTATRTLIHIPGLGRFEAPITLLSEFGRFAYYLATVSLITLLVLLIRGNFRGRDSRRVTVGVVTLSFLGVAAAGRTELLSWPAAGWLALGLLGIAGVLTLDGLRSLPVVVFLVGSLAAGGSVLGQGVGGGLTGNQVDVLVWIAEWCVVVTGLTTPLLLRKRPTRIALAMGAGSVIAIGAAFSTGASTLSILVLWNIGVPGWLPGIAYASAFGGLVVTLWSAIAQRDFWTTMGVVLLTAGGVGMISTYQTGLVLAAVLILGESSHSTSELDDPTDVVQRPQTRRPPRRLPAPRLATRSVSSQE